MDPKLIEKLRRVMALANSKAHGGEQEAQTAAALLQKMLTEHNLSIADLEKKGAAAPDATEQAHDLGKAAFKWKLNLAEAVAEHFYCVSLVDHERKTVRFVGRPDNVESLQMTYAWLIDQIKRIAADERKAHHEKRGEHIDPLRWQVHFGVGAVERLAVRLKEEKARHAAEVARNDMGDVVALAVHHSREVNDYLEKKYGYRRDGQETQRAREWREKHEREEAQKADWLARDPEAYYKRYPEEHPSRVAERKAADEKWYAEYRKKEARNAARRERRASERGYYGREERYDPEKERKEEQGYTARAAGRKAADRINLKPFIEGKTPADASKQVKGKDENE